MLAVYNFAFDLCGVHSISKLLARDDEKRKKKKKRRRKQLESFKFSHINFLAQSFGSYSADEMIISLSCKHRINRGWPNAWICTKNRNGDNCIRRANFAKLNGWMGINFGSICIQLWAACARGIRLIDYIHFHSIEMRWNWAEQFCWPHVVPIFILNRITLLSICH